MSNDAVAWQGFEIAGYELIPPNTTLGGICLDDMYKLDIISAPISSNIMSSEDGRKQ